METNMMRLYFSENVTSRPDCVEEWLYLPRISCGLKARRHRSASTPASRHSKLDVLLFEGFGEFQNKAGKVGTVYAEELRRSGATPRTEFSDADRIYMIYRRKKYAKR